MYIIIGLGNPEKEYEKTRHNVGAMAVDALARELNAPSFKFNKRLHALVTQCQTIIPTANCQLPTSLMLAKPQTFMNLSGKFVSALRLKYRNTLPRSEPRGSATGVEISKYLLIITDDLDLPFGSIRYRERGGAGGHNGLKSIIEHLHTEEFARLKIGIRPAGLARQPGKAEDFVLERFTDKELEELQADIIPRAAQAIVAIIQKSLTNRHGEALNSAFPK